MSVERQEISYVRSAVGLDASNVIFRKLEGCKVVSKEYFSCDDLVVVDGEFSKGGAFNGLLVSSSYLAYVYSNYTGQSIARSTIEIFV